jgi:hypothetical protein
MPCFQGKLKCHRCTFEREPLEPYRCTNNRREFRCDCPYPRAVEVLCETDCGEHSQGKRLNEIVMKLLGLEGNPYMSEDELQSRAEIRWNSIARANAKWRVQKQQRNMEN